MNDEIQFTGIVLTEGVVTIHEIRFTRYERRGSSLCLEWVGNLFLFQKK